MGMATGAAQGGGRRRRGRRSGGGELVGEALQAALRLLHRGLELVVGEHRGDRREQPDRGGEQASIGSAGPYIGLFGTVWGIMTAFTSIAASKNTSLAVVAPGMDGGELVGEALQAALRLLHRGLELVVGEHRGDRRLEGFADEFSAILSRQIDERMALAA
jgi:hypothetical protein